MTRALIKHLNLLVMLAGFLALEIGIAFCWSWPIAAMVGGVLLILQGAYPYLVFTLAKRKG